MHTNKKILHLRGANLLSKTFSVLVFLSTAITQQVLGQVVDDFSDGDFTANPLWSGSSTHFMVNGSQQLQLNNTVASTSYLSTPFAVSDLDDWSWEFYIKQSFAGSANNFGRVYLVSDQVNLTSSLNGYYLQFGEAGSNDAVELFRQTGLVSTSVCRATNAAIASSFEIRVKVSRDNAGLWQIFIDYTGGASLLPEASGSDNTHTSSSFFGLRCTYTAGNANRFFYDDFFITSSSLPDTTPPEVQTVTATSFTQLSVLFSEELDESTAENVVNYLVSDGIANPSSVIVQPDLRTVVLEFVRSFPNGSQRMLTVENVSDLSGNPMLTVQKPFLFFQPVTPGPNDIIITEVFADPSPQIGLPDAEFIEIYNRSSNPFDLASWKITDGGSNGSLSTLLLLPGEYLILSSTSASAQFASFGKRMGVAGFPSLNNAADALVLKDPFGVTIDSVNYSSTWYRDEDKKDGGWSLELIDSENFCAESENWIASINSVGGTPGNQNSVFAVKPDLTGPKLLAASPVNPLLLSLEFDEKLANTLPSIGTFVIEPPLSPVSLSFSDASLTKISLVLSEEIDSAKSYTITVQNVFDCPGNEIQPEFNSVILKLDDISPEVQQVKVVSPTEIEISFSEKIAKSTAENILNYEIVISGTTPVSATLRSDQRAVALLFSQPFVNGLENKLLVQNIQDPAGNRMISVQKSFMFFQAFPVSFKDIIITEIFSDPGPQVGLPEAEFIELYNRSNNPYDLTGWKFTDGSVVTTFSGHILLPGEFLIVCPSNSITRFIPFGKTYGASSFPSLNNSGDAIALKDPDGVLIDSVNYNDSWYGDDEKKDGGWSLELIDPRNTCAEAENWIASDDESGGTPGKQNSVFAEKPDLTSPRLTHVIATDALTLLLRFNEKLGRELPTVTDIIIEPSLEIASVSFNDATLTSIRLLLSEPISGGVKYSITLSNIYDCPGNLISADFNRGEFALPEESTNLDVVINEILFNPRPTGIDFVEVYNRSAKYINLKNWKIGNFEEGLVSNEKIITEEDLLISPQAYLVFTEDGNVLKGEYLQGKEEAFFQTDLPSFPDDEGSVVLINSNGEIIDLFSYTDKMHSAFIKDESGVSLERIDFNLSNEPGNWKSASSIVGFATPGYINSNFTAYASIDENAVSIEPEIFSPLQGQPDFAQIKYNFEKGGYVANVKIFDPAGREIQQLANNELLGTEGFFRWDGEQNDGSKARIGAYMVWFEVFDEKGEVRTFRKRVVVAGF